MYRHQQIFYMLYMLYMLRVNKKEFYGFFSTQQDTSYRFSRRIVVSFRSVKDKQKIRLGGITWKDGEAARIEASLKIHGKELSIDLRVGDYRCNGRNNSNNPASSTTANES